MNAPIDTALLEREPETFSVHEKLRLMMAARIAAGLCANPQTYVQRGWQGETARNALAVADRLILLVGTGGC